MLKRILILDNQDSFIYNLRDYLLQGNTLCDVYRNDSIKVDDIRVGYYQGILLSPGPGRPEQAGKMLELISRFYNSIPLLGICLGHQAIGLHFGATLRHARSPRHGKISKINIETNGVFKELPSRIDVVRYHSLILENIPEELISVIGKTSEGEIMAIQHKYYPIIGLQFHPEAIMTQYGLKIIQNWIATL